MDDFLQQARQWIGSVPFTQDAVAMYFCLIDPRTPLQAKGAIAAALAYFVLPTDAIPDWLAGLGFTDDASVIAMTLATVGACVTDAHRQQAQRWFQAG